MALAITLPAWLAGKAAAEYNKSQLSVDTLTPNSAINHAQALDAAAKARVAQIAPNAQPLTVGVIPNEPGEDYQSSKMASHKRLTGKDGVETSVININPNADASYYAHELGHGISQKTKIGRLVNDARHMMRNSPKLAAALMASLPTATAFTGAALQEGDDDLAASLAIAAAVASPKLVDEALATKNALAIMQDAGTRATLGQRGRLAGGYMSYLAPVLIAGSVGNTVGNFADDYTALYDL